MKKQLQISIFCILAFAGFLGCDKKRPEEPKKGILGARSEDQAPDAQSLEDFRLDQRRESQSRQAGITPMNLAKAPFMVKLLSVGLTTSQIFSRPVEQFRTRFEESKDITAATDLLKAGCKIALDSIQTSPADMDILLSAMVNESGGSGSSQGESKKGIDSSVEIAGPLGKINFADVHAVFQAFCKDKSGARSSVVEIDWGAVFRHYNETLGNLKDVSILKRIKFLENTQVLDSSGQSFGEIFGTEGRRIFVPMSRIPEHVKQAFISAEDKNFYAHSGVDLKGLMRAMISLMNSGGGRPQGGSTITQQVIKNLLINDELSLERKMREMVMAARLERVMSKDQILELYLNYVYLGRSAWGVEMAAQAYFGPGASVSNLSVEGAALLAALVKGPNYFSPDIRPDRAKGRRQYVLKRMREDCVEFKRRGCVSAEQVNRAMAAPLKLAPLQGGGINTGGYFLDAARREAELEAKVKLGAGGRHTLRSTIHPRLQLATERALQSGLVAYEESSGRFKWRGALGSIRGEVMEKQTPWQEALLGLRSRLADVPWVVATVLDLNAPKVGLATGETLSLRAPKSALREMRVYDLVLIERVRQGKSEVAALRSVPQVQGAAVVLENQTGRVLALTGGFSYMASKFNRAILAKRQPGSAIKPFAFLAALAAGFQPNTLIPDTPYDGRLARNWNPQNYDGKTRGLVTFRGAVEQSLNLPTVQLVARLGGANPFDGLKYVQSVWGALGIYPQGEVFTPDFAQVLGSRETRVIDLAQAFATVANEGKRPKPFMIETISEGGRTIYSRPGDPPTAIDRLDGVSFYQLKHLLQGAVARGTAYRIHRWASAIAGKTGTSNDHTDAWFVGFTNDLTVAVWVGYDDKKIYKSLGSEQTGGRVALPIAEEIFKSSFEVYKPQENLKGPSSLVRSQIVELPINLRTGEMQSGGFIEVFRVDARARGPLDTFASLLNPGEISLGYSDPNSLSGVGIDASADSEATVDRESDSLLESRAKSKSDEDEYVEVGND